MSTNLQLCVALRKESIDSGSGPSTVVDQTGQYGRMVNWIKNAWIELQQEKDDWKWMRRSFTVQTVASDGEYAYTDCTDTTTSAVIARFAMWHKRWFQCYLTASGVGAEYRLDWMDWDAFKARYRFGTQTNGQPRHVSVDPSMKFCLGPKPDAIYTVTGDFQLGPQIMTVDADEPEMPSRFHMLIVYEALLKYGFFGVAPEAISRAQSESSRLRFALERDQLPTIRAGRSLA